MTSLRLSNMFDRVVLVSVRQPMLRWVLIAWAIVMLVRAVAAWK